MTLPAGLTAVSTVQQAAGILSQLLGLAALAGVLAAVLALGYRWYAGSAVPGRLAVLVGGAGVALYLGTTAALETVIRSAIEPTEVEIALFNIGALLAGAGGAVLGRRVGDQFGTDVLLWSPTQNAGDVSRLAQTVGKVTTVTLPAAVDDAAGYDPVPDRTKDRLAGKQFVFPRGLTVEELGQRLIDRLKSDYGVGTVDVEFADDGSVTHLAVGTRAAGIGSTLPPATNAVAVRADPGFSASTGDIVQVWETDPPRRMLTGELRGVADDVVTVAVDAADTPKVDPTQQYRLVTLPVEDRPDREFASLLRAAEETFSSVTVEAGSPLHGLPVGALDLTITAIRPEDGDPVPFPPGSYRLAPGDLLFVIALPAGLRRLEAAASPLDPSIASSSQPADDTEPTEGIRTTAQATADSFEEIKSGIEQDADTAESAEAADDSVEPAAAAANGSQEPSFDDLKAEFDSGEAEWSDDEPAEATADRADDSGHESDSPEPSAEPGGDEPDTADESADDESDIEIAFADDSSTDATDDQPTAGEDDTPAVTEQADSSTAGEDDGLVSLEEADITFDDEREDESDDADGGYRSGDLGDLEFDDEQSGAFEFDDDDPFESDGESDGTDDDEDEAASDDDDDDDSGGGGSSFADLKAEFESGEADWEDEISDSPGGDMRLDE